MQHAIGQREHLALRTPGGDDHVIGDAGFALEVDDDKIFGLAVGESLLDDIEKGGTNGRIGMRLGFTARYGGHLLSLLPPLPSRAPGRSMRADLRGRACIEPGGQEHPGGRDQIGEASSRLGRHPPAGIPFRRQLGQSFKTIGRAGEDCNGNAREDLVPMLPVADLRQVVSTHQPYETPAREDSLQFLYCIHRVSGAERRFEVENPDPRIGADAPRGGDARLERRHAALRLQRILRRNKPPHLVEPEPLQRFEADVQVTGMGGIEGAAEQPDSLRRQSPERRTRQAQGRTCPSPRTIYL
jgi:hypothetical protein